jgi:hypothetical protein
VELFWVSVSLEKSHSVDYFDVLMMGVGGLYFVDL